ncbi:molybdenum cofactor biosynthesis protein MoaE [Limnochorda pilosa]|uniref:Molybdenum cofactor biosynthesis protein MoaE n=1 Tax=Limnochorda pilosa TaxID=1555112 RepID=A0A0K2SJH2_LIMPI|nr:molybdenum cofactor biosynthesis protein MoaE [Limnochorda pilosa]BAS27004.1 molybdenum cofactor biosynthesis protein MoaE [Limnochorda pilosa]
MASERSVSFEEKVGLVREPLVPQQVAARVEGPTTVGGSVCFVGWVREWTGARRTLELEYEAYEPMALREMAALVELAQRRWSGVDLAMVHRLGVLKPGEAAVVVAAAAPHRNEAFEACRWAIERLKEQVPIWKRERYADGTEEWVGLERRLSRGRSSTSSRS